MTVDLAPGGTVYVEAAASVQFVQRPILFRIGRAHGADPCTGFGWVDGYELDERGRLAVEQRSIYVRYDGLRPPQPVTTVQPLHTVDEFPTLTRQDLFCEILRAKGRR